MKIKLLLLICLLLLTQNCNDKYFIRDYSTKPSSVPSKKIALIGFYPNHITSSTSSGRQRTDTAGQNYNKPLKSFFSNGKDIKEFKQSGLRTDLKEEDVKNFFDQYISKVKISGVSEINNLVEVKKIEENKFSYKMKKYDADYYVVGYLMPIFAEGNLLLEILGRLSTLPSLATFGTIPTAFFKMHSETRIEIYDKNFKFVKEFTYENTYSIISAWWVTPTIPKDKDTEHTVGSVGSTPKSIVFISDIKQANDEVTEFISSLPASK